MGLTLRPIAIVVCIVSFLGSCLQGGNLRSSGVLYDELLKQPCSNESIRISDDNATANATGNSCGGFGASRGVTAWTTSILLALRFITSPISAFLTDRYGCRLVALVGTLTMSAGFLTSSFAPSVFLYIFLYGVMGGIGWGLVYTPTIVIIPKHWQKYNAFANGLVASGAGLGAIILGPLSHYLVKLITWRGFLRVLSSLFFVQSLLCLFYVEGEKRSGDSDELVKEEEGEKTKKNKFVFHWDLLRDPAVRLVFLTRAFFALGYTVPIVHLIRFAGDVGISQQSAALLVTYQGVAGIVGRLGAGTIANLPCVDVSLISQLCLLFTGLPMFALPFASNPSSYWAFVIYIVAYGATFGGFMAVYPVFLTNLVGRQKMTQAFGWSLACQAPFVAVSTPIAGWLHDATGSYRYSFYFGGSALCLSFLCLSSIRFYRRDAKDEKEIEMQSLSEEEDKISLVVETPVETHTLV